MASSAGNYGTFSNSSDNPYILTVSATDQSDVIYYYSNTGKNIDLAAPGDSFSTQMGGGYVSTGGTSYSSPIVAGVAALVISANPSLSGAQIQNILKESADDLGALGWDSTYGSGRVNAARAVSMAAGGATVDMLPPNVSFTAPTAGATVSGVITVQVSATDNVGVNSVTLSVDGVGLGTDNASPFSFVWDSAIVPNGSHTFTATVTDDSGNSSTASVSVNVNNAVIFDTTPPSVKITSPSNGSKALMNLAVYVNASDNVKVVKVELYADGTLVSAATSAPFTTKWSTKKVSAGTHSLQCKAYDGAGNSANSEVVIVYK